MSTLRPECKTSTDGISIPRDTALYLIRDSVAKRRSLIHGRLHDGNGKHCAIGCFFTDNPHAAIPAALIEEVAAVNDSLPKSATPHQRWKKVNDWLKWKLKTMAAAR